MVLGVWLQHGLNLNSLVGPCTSHKAAKAASWTGQPFYICSTALHVVFLVVRRPYCSYIFTLTASFTKLVKMMLFRYGISSSWSLFCLELMSCQKYRLSDIYWNYLDISRSCHSLQLVSLIDVILFVTKCIVFVKNVMTLVNRTLPLC